MRFNGINHLAMATSDIDSTIRFWRDLLGMRMILGMGRPGYRHYFFEISDTCSIAFFEWPDISPIDEKEHGQPVTGPYVFDHVSFGIDTEEELWALKARIDASGFWVSEVIDHGFIHSIYSFDPNGIAIEFSVNVKDLDVRKSPVIIDPEPTATALEGPEPNPETWPRNTEQTPLSERRVYLGEGNRQFAKLKRN